MTIPEEYFKAAAKALTAMSANYPRQTKPYVMAFSYLVTDLQPLLAINNTNEIVWKSSQLIRDTHARLEHRWKNLLQTLGEGSPPEVVTLDFVEAELRKLSVDDSWKNFQINLPRCYVSATMGPVTINGISLGEFELRLSWAGYGMRAYALQPNPAFSNGNVTHPHVDSHKICLGDANTAFHRALGDGRIIDAFELTRAVLENEGSNPYVPTRRWRGASFHCSDCQDIVYESNVYRCQYCTDALCQNCKFTCSDCSSIRCGKHAKGCACCGNIVCLGHFPNCLRCKNTFCSKCHKTACPDPCDTPCKACGKMFPSAMVTNDTCEPCSLKEELHGPSTVADTASSGMVEAQLDVPAS